MITIKNRELIIPHDDLTIGTQADNNSETRIFVLDRYLANGVDLAALTFGMDMEYEDGSTRNATYLTKEISDDLINLTWGIVEGDVQIPGTMFVQISAFDYDGTVRWSTKRQALYVEPVIGTAAEYNGDLSAFQRMEVVLEALMEDIQGYIETIGDIEIAEAGRVIAEDGRVLAEQGRVSAEDDRVLAEAARDSAFNTEIVQSEAWAVGTKNGVPVTSDDPQYENNSKYHATEAAASESAAAESEEEAEAWAVGTKGGTPVTSDEPQYENSAKDHADAAAISSSSAAESEEEAEAWAVGTKGGTPVTSDEPQYENSAKDHADAAAGSALSAAGSEIDAEAAALEAEGWANGTQRGIPVSEGSKYKNNNSKFWKDQAQAIAEGSIGGLSDVTITDLQDGQTIVSNNGEFENVDFAFSELTDVDYGSPTDGQVPYYDSDTGKLKFKTVSATFSGLTDVNFTSLQNGQIPIYDSANQKWVNVDMTRFVSIPIPTSTTYTYDGTAQNFAFDSIETSLVNVTSGTQTNAGTYTVTCSLKGAYDYWTDLTNAPKTFTWTIAKAQGSITLASNTATVTPLITSVNIGLTVVGDGTVTATSSDTSVVTSSVVGSNIEIDGVYKGSATITVTLADGTNYIGDSDTITVTSTYIPLKTFAAATDQEIADMVEAADLGYIDLYDDAGWRVGMEHSVSLSAIAASGTYDGVSWTVGEAQDAQTATLALLHQGLYELVTSVLDKQGQTRNTCSFIVGLKNCMETYGYMNATASNAGSWNSCARRNWCNGGFRSAIPSALQGAFKQFKTITATEYNAATNTTSNDYFALSAEKEIIGTQTGATSTEASALTQFTYYETAANRIKTRGESGGGNAVYFARSPYYGLAAQFCTITSSGTYGSTNANNDRGFSPFGCM